MKKDVKIYMGAYYASREPAVVSTLLGSCVAVCLYDPVKCMGGMNHIVLPGSADLKHFDSAARYGINAMELLINRIMALGGARNRLVAKAFGGAHVLPAISPENGIGRRNAEFVVEFLELEKIKLLSHDMGGHEARKILFHTDTGEVLLKRIPSTHYQKIAEEERKLFRRMRRKSKGPGDVTLFTPT